MRRRPSFLMGSGFLTEVDGAVGASGAWVEVLVWGAPSPWLCLLASACPNHSSSDYSVLGRYARRPCAQTVPSVADFVQRDVHQYPAAVVDAAGDPATACPPL